MPILVDEHDEIIAGHGRFLAAQWLTLTEVPVVVARGWSDEQRRAYRLADNKLSLNSTWDDKLLALEVKDLREMGFNMGLAGFNASDLTSLDDILTEEEATELVQSNGSLLALVDIAIAEPKHQVLPGEVWKVGPHSLHVVSVLTGWASWAAELHGEAVVFCPYPSPFVPLSDKANDHRLVMVQPDPYICGHLLDRYVEVKGKRSVKRVKDAHQ